MEVSLLCQFARSAGINAAKRSGVNTNPHPPGSKEFESYERGFTECINALGVVAQLEAELC